MFDGGGLFNSENFLPHGHCFLWQPQILWLHVVSDAVITVSYLSLPVALLFFARRRKDIPLRYVFILFGAFIVLCGLTHLFSIWVLWKPDYGPEGIVKALTAAASALTAIVTWKIMPYALALPSPAQLQEMNARLTQTNREIEREVALRTAELEAANARLQDSERQLQQVARQNAQQFRILVDGVTDYAIYLLDPQGSVVSWNAGAQRIKGYTAEEIIGQNFSRFYLEEDQAAGEPARALQIAAREGKYEKEGLRVRKDGSRFHAHVVIDPIFDEAHHLAGYAKVTRDVTEQHAAREALDKAREQLYQAQKMETIGHLTGGIAHDFNNLLQAVIGSLALISKFSFDEKMRPLIETAQKAAARGARLTQQLLAFSRQQALRPEIAQINRTVETFEPLLLQACGYGVRLAFDLAPDLGLADIDQTQFQSGLLNLAINARDAMPSGGTLTIRTRNITLDSVRATALSEIAPGPYILVEVVDTGHGMTAEVKAKAIEPFYTTKEVGKGSGLGLSQVYGFVRQSGGQMEIESAVGQGTAIRLYLPQSFGTIATADPPVPHDAFKTTGLAPQPHDDKGKARAGVILVVEDDPLVLAVTAESVRGLGYNVRTAIDARRALAILGQEPHIDLLFTDVIMPGGMNGLDLAREALKLRPSMRVLMVSGYSREILAAKEGVANMLLMRKPYEISELAQAIDNILSR